MSADEGDRPDFAADLYRGTGDAYDRFRPGYPKELIQDLLRRVAPSGNGRLLDLACGTGQLAFPLAHAFAEVWAVDQEPDMIRVVDAKMAAGSATVRPVLSSAERLDAPPGWFELITVGNAFHRLRREVVAGKASTWLRPNGYLALCWSEPPWAGPADWQHILAEALERWRVSLGAGDRIPPDWESARSRRPDAVVLRNAGYVAEGRFDVTGEHLWSIADVVGAVYSTSFLPRHVVAEHAAAFESDLVDRLGPYATGGMLVQVLDCAYELVRRP